MLRNILARLFRLFLPFLSLGFRTHRFSAGRFRTSRSSSIHSSGSCSSPQSSASCSSSQSPASCSSSQSSSQSSSHSSSVPHSSVSHSSISGFRIFPAFFRTEFSCDAHVPIGHASISRLFFRSFSEWCAFRFFAFRTNCSSDSISINSSSRKSIIFPVSAIFSGSFRSPFTRSRRASVISPYIIDSTKQDRDTHFYKILRFFCLFILYHIQKIQLVIPIILFISMGNILHFI